MESLCGNITPQEIACLMTRLRTIVLEYDLIEIHYNENLKRNPYLVRVFSYNNDPVEFRVDENDIQNLYGFLRKNGVL